MVYAVTLLQRDIYRVALVSRIDEIIGLFCPVVLEVRFRSHVKLIEVFEPRFCLQQVRRRVK